MVDDSRSIVAMVQYALEKAGYQVFSTNDGKKGLERLKETVGQDIIICDLTRPNMDGLTLL